MLRGLLAVYVVLGHSRWLLWAGHAEWSKQTHAVWEVPLAYASASLRFGNEAVMVFFVLSGFFIHLPAAERLFQGATVALSTTRFYRRRAHRLVAPYLFALVVTAVCDWIGWTWFPRLYSGKAGDALLDQTFTRAGYVWQSILPALALLPSSLGRDFGSNGPLWSLSYEVVYYAVYPAWLAVRTRHSKCAFGLVPLLCMVWALLPRQFAPLAALFYYPVWLAGAALAEWLIGRQPNTHALKPALLVFSAGMVLHLLSHSIILTVCAATMFGSAVVGGFCALPDCVSQSKIGAAAEQLGIRSYTLYIVHFPFLALMAAWLIQTRGRRPLAGWFAMIGGLSTLAAGVLCFAACERHFLHQRLGAEVSEN